MLQEIKDFCLIQAVGEHTRCVVTGIIDEAYMTIYMDEVNGDKSIKKEEEKDDG